MAEIKHKIFQRTRKNLFLHTISVETYGLDDIHQAINEVLDLITKVNNEEKF